jgi:hypothetical protein
LIKATGQAEKIILSSETGDLSLEVGMSLQLIATLTPDAAYPTIDWQVTEGSDYASVDLSGSVTGKAEGTATIRGTTLDGSNLTAEIEIEVLPVPVLVTQPETIGKNTYQTYKYDNTIWMVEDLKEGTYTYDRYDNDPNKLTYYYSRSQANVACPAGWALPSVQDASALVTYINLYASPAETSCWTAPSVLKGNCNSTNWEGWGTTTLWWTTTLGESIGSISSSLSISNAGEHRLRPIRCIKVNVE